MKYKLKDLFEAPRKELGRFRSGLEWAVLPIGVVNLTTGKNQFFNVLSNNPTDTIVLCKMPNINYIRQDDPKSDPTRYVGIIGTKGRYAEEGARRELRHDQTGARLGTITVIGHYEINRAGFDEIRGIVKRPGLRCAVFK